MNRVCIIDGGYVSGHVYDNFPLRRRSVATMFVTRRISDVDRCLFLLLVIPSLSLLLLLSFSSLSLEPLSTLTPTRNLTHTHNLTVTTRNSNLSSPCPTPPDSYFAAGISHVNQVEVLENIRRKKEEELANSKIELTGPSIIEKILKVYPNADLFLNSPLDQNSFKLWLLKDAPRLAWVRIFEPKPIIETESMVRVLTPMDSAVPNNLEA